MASLQLAEGSTHTYTAYPDYTAVPGGGSPAPALGVSDDISTVSETNRNTSGLLPVLGRHPPFRLGDLELCAIE